MTGELFHLRNTALAITERCTLKCKLCFAYIPYHDNPQDMTISEISTVLERYFSIVSSVDSFCITGGEPLLHRDLLTILEMLSRYSGQINKTMDLITNGTLEIKSKVLRFLQNKKNIARVIISDYGKYSPKAKTLAGKLSSLGINVRVEGYNGESPLYGGWVDCSDHSLKHFTQHDVDEQGKSCYFKNKRGYTIRKGELHNCGRSYWRMLQNIIPRNPDEYLDLLDTMASIDQQRKILRKLHEKVSVTSCAYCWGANDHSERHMPAEQLL
jgi:hypothetical protein